MCVLISFSCTNSFGIIQNQSFFQFVPLVYIIFSYHNLQLVGNYIYQVIITFAFCAVSLLSTSRYVLIDYGHLTHFLCCNLFVMLCWITSAISSNVLEIHLPITGI